MKKTVLVLTAAIACTGGAVSAQNIEADVGLSSLGLTLQGRYSYSETLKVRGLIAGGLQGDATEDIDNVEYDIDGSFRSIGVIADYHPLSNGFHVSAGLIAANLDLNGSARSDGTTTIEVGGTTYGAAGDGLDLGMEFANAVSPYLGVGYNASLGDNWALGAELGAVFTGGVDIQGQAFGAVSQADLDAEIADASEDIGSDADIYPFLSISVGFKF